MSLNRVLKKIGNLNHTVSTPDRRLKARLCQAYEGHVMTVSYAMLAQMDVAQENFVFKCSRSASGLAVQY